MSLYPPKREKMDPKDFEKVPTGDFVKGEIAEVQYEKEHKFTGQYAKVTEAVRLKFQIEGCKFPHYSRWMIFTTGEKSNLYNKFLLPLVEGVSPDCSFDLEELKGFKIKMVWQNDAKNEDYQVLQLILPLQKKAKVKFVGAEKTETAEIVEHDDSEEVPF